MSIRSRYILLTLAVGYCLCAFAQLHAGLTTNLAKPPAGENPAPRTVKTSPKDGLKYVWIPAGTFMMGCSPGDSQCAAGERPAHQVTITKGFWMGQTDVTVAAYKRFVAVTGKRMPTEPNYVGGRSTQGGVATPCPLSM